MAAVGLSRAESFKPHDPENDLITVQYEHYFGTPFVADSIHAPSAFPAWWLYATLPGFRILSKEVFWAVELDGMVRDIREGNASLSDSPFQRYGLFTGVTLIEKAGHTGSFLAGAGVAGELSDPDFDDSYVHLIYEHRYRISRNLTLGLGVLAMNNFGEWQSPLNLLPYLSWHISERKRFRIAWDVVEFKQFLTERISTSAEVRYDMSFFRIDSRIPYELETVAVGGGPDIWLFRHFYLRLRYKELLYRNETLELPGGTEVTSERRRGRSVKVQVVYGK